MQLNLKLAVLATAVALAACGKKEEAAPATEAAAPAAAPAAAEAQVIKIGHVGPTSGAIAHLGKDNENGARMAIDELNAASITIGGQPVKFELLAEDDAADPKQGTAAAQKLVDAKVAGVIGHLNSGTTIPASQIYHEAGIPQISPSATTPKYTRQGYEVVGNRYFAGLDDTTVPFNCYQTRVEAPEYAKGGHGTSDYYLVQAFLDSIEFDLEPPINVDRAMQITLPGLVAHEAAVKGHVWLDVPQFT